MLLFGVFTLALFSSSFGTRTMTRRRETLPVVGSGAQCDTFVGAVATCPSGLQCCPAEVGMSDNSVCMKTCPFISRVPDGTIVKVRM
ncbi:hypothetical protein BDZ89DRAFT_666461 [Hymenopellis radicata]|nr:hypothetical protein BDZ89DRAFT_666461 [Hymenopellis radicata]